MLGLFILLPLLIIFTSLGYLFIDVKKPKAWLIALAVGVIQLGIFGGLVLLATWINSDQETLLEKISAQAKTLDDAERLENLVLTRLSVDPSATEQAFQEAALHGFTPQSQTILRGKAADQALTKLLDNRQSQSRSTGITVLQVPEETNQILVSEILRRLGYDAYYTQAEPKAGTDTASPKEASNEEKETEEDVIQTQEADGSISLTLNFDRPPPKKQGQHQYDDMKALKRANALFLGAKVSMKDAKIVALVLIRAGVEIKHLKRIKKHTTKNEKTILIEFKKAYERRPALTPSRVTALKRVR